MYVSIHVCIHACMHVCIHACMHVCMYVYMYVGNYVGILIDMTKWEIAPSAFSDKCYKVQSISNIVKYLGPIAIVIMFQV